ncbi:MAG: hypothetical protein Q9209_000598 [Squamulea sp. 1 TL-2023]
MRFSVFLSFGLATGLVQTLESACGPLATVTVTVTASTVTASLINQSPSHSSAAARTTLSSTSYTTSTKVISIDHHTHDESAQPSSALDGPYSFAEEYGSTRWLGGKTPSSGAVFVTNTQVVTLQPQPSSTETVSFTTSSGTTLSSEGGTTTSWTTLSSTSFYTHYLTNVLSRETAATSLPAPKSAYLGDYGWNSTSTTLQTLASDVALTKPSSGLVTASISLPSKRVHARQVGALVTATIDGVVVTWTNVWAGDPITSKAATSNPAISSKCKPSFRLADWTIDTSIAIEFGCSANEWIMLDGIEE